MRSWCSQMNSERCQSHLDHTRWSRAPVPDRDGWELARCDDCGTFIGMNPVPNTKQADKQAKVQAAAEQILRDSFDWGSDEEMVP